MLIVRVDDAQGLRNFANVGYAVLDNVFSDSLLADLKTHGEHWIRSRIENKESEPERDIMTKPRGKGRTQYYLDDTFPLTSQQLDALVNSDRIIHFVREVMQSDDFTCSSISIMRSKPGSATQPWHTDVDDLFEKHIQCQLPCYFVNVFIPLISIDSTQIGPTQFRDAIPFVHADQVLIFHGTVEHRGMKNMSRQNNDKVMLVYKRTWFVDENDKNADEQ